MAGLPAAMGMCSACEFSHPHPGEKSCRSKKDALEKCKAAGIEENRWGEFMDVDTLQELAKSVKGAEGDSAANVSQLEWDALKQASVNQTSHMQKLESEISKLSAHLGILLSIQPNQVPSTIQAVLAVTMVTPVATSVSTSNL